MDYFTPRQSVERGYYILLNALTAFLSCINDQQK